MGERLDQFRQQLADSRSRADSVKSKSPYEIARDVLNAGGKVGGYNYPPVTAGEGESWWHPGEDFTRILDIVSRPLQAHEASVGEFFKQFYDAKNAGQETPTIWDMDKGKILGRGLSAFKGDEPYLGGDLMHQMRNQAPTEESDWINGLAGFGIDVVGDPLNLIPVSWLGKAAKLVPGGVEGATRLVKNTAKTVTEPALAGKIDKVTLTPEQAASPEAAAVALTPGNAVAPTVPVSPTILPDNAAAAGANIPVGETDIIDKLNLTDWAAEEPGVITRSSEPLANDPFATNPVPTVETPSPAVGTGPDRLSELLAQREAITKSVSEVELPKYRKEQIPEPFHISPETTTLEEIPVADAARRSVAQKIVETSPHYFDMQADEAGEWVNSVTGKKIGQEEFDQIVDDFAKSPNLYDTPITGWNAADEPVELSAGTFAKSLEKGVHPAPKDITIAHEGDFHPIHDVVRAIHEDLTKAGPQTREVVTPGKTVPFTVPERLKWKAEISKTVDPEDLATFAQLGVQHYNAYSKNVAKVLELKRAAKTLAEVRAAVNSKEIPPKMGRKILESMGAKTWDDAEKILNDLEEEITTLEARRGVDDLAGTGTPGTAESGSTARTEATEAIPEEVTSQLAPDILMSPEDIVNHAEKTGDTTLLNGDKKPVALTSEQKNDVFEALKHSGFRDFTEEGLKKYKHETKGGAKTTSPEPYGGLAHKQDNFNAFKQLTLWNGLMGKSNSVWKRIPAELDAPNIAKLGKGTKEYNAAWDLRGKFLYDEIVPELKAAELTIKNYGIEPILGRGFEGLPLSMHDVIMAFPRKFSERYLFAGTGEGSRHIPPTIILKAVRTTLAHVKINGGSTDFLKIKTTPEYLAWRNEVSKILKEKIGASDATARNTPFNLWIQKGIASKDAKLSKYAGAEFERVIQNFAHAAPHLEQALNANWARLAMEKGTYVQRLSADVTKRFGDDVLAARGNSTETLALVDNLDAIVEAAVKGAEKVPPPGVVNEMIKPVLESAADDVIPVAEIKTEVEAAKDVERAADDPVVTAKVTAALQADAEKIVDEVAGTVASTGSTKTQRLIDIGEHIAYAGAGVRAIRAIFPHVGNAELRPLHLNAQTAVRGMHNDYRTQLNKYARTYGREATRKSWEYLQKGIKPSDLKDETAAQALADFEKLSSWALNPKVHSAQGVMNRTSVKTGQLNRHLDRQGIKEDWHFKGRKKDRSMVGWTEWENVDDPLELLSKVNAAVFASHAENILGASISRMGSATAFEGSVKIGSSKQSTILNTVIDKNLYYSEDMAKQVMVLDETLRELMKPLSTNKVMNFYDGATKTLKTHYTIYRLGHHVRNTYGDMWLSYMDGMTNPLYYKRGADVIRSRKELYSKGLFEDVDAIAERGISKKKAFTVWHNGKEHVITNGEAYDLMKSTGNFPDVAAIEDISDPAAYDFTGKWAKSKYNPLKGRVNKAASEFSEIREHSMRAPHWLYTMERDHQVLNPKLSFEDALVEAANKATSNVRKWHPDGSDLSQFERKYLRRTILFYSWIRKVAPLMLYSMAVRPARFTQYNKAMTEFAAANNIDVEFGDPFPQDQLFPEWLENGASGPIMGAAGSYFGIDPGLPGQTVFTDYAPGTAKQTLMGGLNPAIKYPGQLLSHGNDTGVASNWQTGGNYANWTDYLTSGIPNLGLAEVIAGGRLPTRSEAPSSNEGYEPQLDLPGGKTLGAAQIAGLNWATGLGIQDQSRPSYAVSALKDRERRFREQNK